MTATRPEPDDLSPPPERQPPETPPDVPAVAVLHQEGVVAVIALVGLMLRDGSVAAGLAARGGPATAVAVGALAGTGAFAALWLARGLAAPLRQLEGWQRRMVASWTPADVVAVAVFSGLAEEALVRALLQPMLGLVPAAAIFAVLHVVPDRKLWMWPVIAFVLGIGLGWLFAWGGYPAAACAHTVLNGLALGRLRAHSGSRGEP